LTIGFGINDFGYSSFDIRNLLISKAAMDSSGIKGAI